VSATADTRMPAARAAQIAKRFLALIEPHCEKIVVAGSLRRRATMVGDIEVCAVPRVETVQDREPGLFEDVVTDRLVDRLHEAMEQLLADGVVSKRLTDKGLTHWGESSKHLTFEGAPIDLSSTEADRFGWLVLLRTGPYLFSRQLVVERGHKTADRRPGLLPTHLRVDKGIVSRVSGERYPTPDEESVFKLFGLPYRAPEHRR
jgi:DNA polymerase/3'-5' exonuclease PolX